MFLRLSEKTNHELTNFYALIAFIRELVVFIFNYFIGFKPTYSLLNILQFEWYLLQHLFLNYQLQSKGLVN